MNTNPNECGTCDHRLNPEGGWCYMFRHEPTDVCMKHTARNEFGGPATAATKAARPDKQEVLT